MVKLLSNIGCVLLFINLILFLKGFFKYGKAFKVFTTYLCGIFIIQVTSIVLRDRHINNLYISHFYFIFQLIILGYFYIIILKEDSQKKLAKASILLCLAVLGIQYSYNPDLFFKFNLFEIFITSFLLIIFSVFHFYNLLNDKKEFYYINMGVLIYLFASTILFLVGNLMASLSAEVNKITWILNASLYIVYQLLVFTEWRKNFSKKL